MAYGLVRNTEHYKNCFCHKDGGDSIVRLLEFPHDRTGVAHILQQEIIFVVRGNANIAMEGTNLSRRLRRGEFIFMPAGSRLACDVAHDTVLLLVNVAGKVPECPVFKMDKSPNGLTGRDPGIHVLKANKRIRNLVSEIIITLEDGFLCRHFLQGEANRLMFLLNAYYPEEERIKFFSRILTPDIKFSEFVRINHMKYRTIGEMAEALYMTSQAFSSRFKKVFGMTPHKWMQQEKARQIYLDICRSDMPLKEIAIKYDFPLSSNFFRFCKQTFGESPGNIRKYLHKNIGGTGRF